MNSYIAKEKLPKELAAKQRRVSTLQRVTAQPAMGQQEIDSVNKQVQFSQHNIILHTSKMKLFMYFSLLYKTDDFS